MDTKSEIIQNDPITDQEFLLACELVTQIHDYFRSNYSSYYQTGSLFKFTKEQNPSSPVSYETPNSLVELQRLSWCLLDSSHWRSIGSENCYQGIILVNHTNKLILLAHRGMQFHLAPNLAAGLQIGKLGVPDIVNNALAMCNIALETAKNYNYNLHHTGFSMGGFLAQITSTYCNHNHKGTHNRARCYDPAGAGETIKHLEYKDNQKNITIYVTYPNVVNTAAPLYGYVRQINMSKYIKHNPYLHNENLRSNTVMKPLIINFESFLSPNLPPIMNVLSHTLQSHNQTELREDLSNQPNFKFKCVKSWPLATNVFTSVPESKSYIPATNEPFAMVFLKSLANTVNEYLKIKSQGVTNLARMPEINAITHQILNPQIHHFGETDSVSPVQVTSQISMETLSAIAIASIIMLLVKQRLKSQNEALLSQSNIINNESENISSAKTASKPEISGSQHALINSSTPPSEWRQSLRSQPSSSTASDIEKKEKIVPPVKSTFGSGIARNSQPYYGSPLSSSSPTQAPEKKPSVNSKKEESPSIQSVKKFR